MESFCLENLLNVGRSNLPDHYFDSRYRKTPSIHLKIFTSKPSLQSLKFQGGEEGRGSWFNFANFLPLKLTMFRFCNLCLDFFGAMFVGRWTEPLQVQTSFSKFPIFFRNALSLRLIKTCIFIHFLSFMFFVYHYMLISP